MPDPKWTSDNVTEVAIRGLWSNGRPVVNVLHVKREEDDAAASARDVLNNWQDHIVGALANNYTCVGAHFRDRNETAGVVGDILADAAKPRVGGSSGASSTPNVAVLVRKLGVFHAGQKPGRFFLPGIEESAVDEDGMLTTTFISAMNALLAAFLSGLSGAGSNQLVTVHFAPTAPLAGVTTDVTQLVTDPKVATQRRRLRK